MHLRWDLVYLFETSVYNYSLNLDIISMYLLVIMLTKVQAFKVMVNDPDSVLDSLTREVKEVGPDGQEVVFIHIKKENKNLQFIL